MFVEINVIKGKVKRLPLIGKYIKIKEEENKMKKLIFLLLSILLLVLSGCDNNEGPFEFRMEKGNKVLYSGKKPAKGWIKNTIYSFRKDANVVVYEIYFDGGIPTGEFKLYNDNGELVIEGKGRWTEKGFEGAITEPLVNGKGTGVFNFNSEFLISFNGENYYEFCYRTLTDGQYIGDNYKFEKQNNKYTGEYLEYYDFNKNLAKKITYKNGKKNGKYLEYYSDGNLFRDVEYKDDKVNGKSLEYYDNGKLKYDIEYKENKKNGKYLEYNQFGLVRDIEYKEDQYDGKYLEYYNNGKLKYDIEYKNGYENGKYLEYNLEGKLILKIIYKNGVKVSQKIFN